LRPLIFLLCCFITGCTHYEYLGTEQPELANSACSIDTEKCFFNYNQGGTTLYGSYSLNNVGGGAYSISGSAMLDISESSIIYDEYEGMDLTFIFFKDNLVVHEETVRLNGIVKKYIKFSQLIKSDVIFESSSWAGGKFETVTYEYEAELEDDL